MKLQLENLWAKRQRIADERLKICKECEHLEHTLLQCEVCGCFMKGKTLFPFSKCPLDKWDKYEEEKK